MKDKKSVSQSRERLTQLPQDGPAPVKNSAVWQDRTKWKMVLPICGMLAVCAVALVLGVLSMLKFTLPEMNFTQQGDSWEICELVYDEKTQSFSLENRRLVELSPDMGAPVSGQFVYGGYRQMDSCDPALFSQAVQTGETLSLGYRGLVYYSGCFYLAGEREDGWYLTYWDGSFPPAFQQPIPLGEFCSQAFWYHLYQLSGGNGLYKVF